MRVVRGSRRASAGPSSPEADTRRLEGPTLDGPRDHDAALDRALDLARSGDEAGFVQLWRALQPPLLRYLTVRGNDAPEDLAAETWLQVVRDLHSFRGRSADFRAWLFTVARHRAIDHGRARASRPVVPVADPVGSGLTRGASHPSAEQDAAEREATATALRLVASLPPEQAEMVMLRVVAGLDVATVAGLVGKTPGAVRVAVHRALKSLSRDPRIRSTREVV
jgi:RNA polymerase sigma-70 factor, ECF subfamily